MEIKAEEIPESSNSRLKIFPAVLISKKPAPSSRSVTALPGFTAWKNAMYNELLTLKTMFMAWL
jgi:hypothetical protein